MFEQYWYASGSAGPGPGPVPPDPGQNIGQSLRFRGDQRLTAPEADFQRPAGDFTLSMWIKHARAGNSTDSVSLLGNNDSTRGYKIGSTTNTGNGDMLGSRDGSALNMFSNARFRDPSAWYHLVFQNTGETTTAFVNGQRLTDTQNTFPRVGDLVIGSGNPGSMDERFNGYMADIYMIDGQVLEPTAFGRENAQGIWVPREVDFTPAGMRWSDFLFTDVTNTAAGATPNLGTTSKSNIDQAAGFATNAFDGDTTTRAYTSGVVGAWFVWRPETAIQGVTSARVFIEANNTGQLWLNGTQTTFPGDGSGSAQWVDLNVSGTIDLENIAIQGRPQNSAGATLFAIEVTDANGTRILTNPFLWSADLATNNPGGFQEPATNAFNGSTADPAAMSGNTNGLLTWSPSTDVTFTNTLEVFCKAGLTTPNYIAAWDGNQVNYTHNTWVTVATGGGTINAATPLTIQADPNDQAALAAVRIDGQIYVDGVNSSYGANGFHLDFADPDDIGADRSGNGNDFTATGFETVPPKDPQWQTYAESWGTAYSNQPSAVFSGAATASFEPYDWYFLQPSTATLTGVLQEAGVEAGDVIRFTVYPRTASITCDISGTSGSASGNTGQPHTVDVTVPAQGVTSCTITGTDPTYWGIGAISVNGVMLINGGSGSNYDLMQDSPTQNFATLNPVIAGPFGFSTVAANLADANLQMGTPSAGATDPTAIPTQLITGRKYFETNIVSGNSALDLYLQPEGVNPESGTVQQNRVVRVGGANTGAASGVDVNNADGTLEDDFTAPAGNRVLGLDVDTDTGNVRVFMNGTLEVTATGYTGNRVLHFIINGQTGAYEVFFNGGQQPFLHRPDDLDDTNNLQTQNLPAADIVDGREHFQAITGPGDGPSSIDPATQIAVNSYTNPSGFSDTDPANDYRPYQGFNGDEGGTYFFVPNNTNGELTPAIVFDEPMTGTTFEIFASVGQGSFFINGTERAGNAAGWVDISTEANGSLESLGFNASAAASDGFSSLKIDGLMVIEAGILPLARATFPTGLWWIKDRVNSNQHQLVDSVNGNSCVRLPGPTSPANYVAPNGNSVAWCWSTTEDWTGNGVTTNRRNPVAGFSHFNYTGDGNDTRDLDHGLGAPPDWVFIFQPNANDVNCYVRGLTGTGSSTQNLILSTSEAAGNVFSAGIIYAPDNNTTFTVGLSQSPTNVNGVNQDGVVYRAYCWHSVPNYSAFGSYVANNDPNGPVIVTGFRPAFVIIKSTGSSGWNLIDTTTNVNNPADVYFLANSTSGELTGDATIDILSNGFKIRQNTSEVNNGSNSYVWAAFAENPFGSSNSSPANAR